MGNPYLTFPYGESDNESFNQMYAELMSFINYYKEHRDN